MSVLRELPKGGLVRGKLPRGCSLCERGAKMVLLVTGKCGASCYYCPISAEKAGRDIVFADEMRVRSSADILLEARLIDALGTGITGGDPLCAPKRTIDSIKLLKNKFGKKHHIHLYTAGNVRPELISRLALAGLDEIRFHPPPRVWERLENTELAGLIRTAKGAGMVVGAEVPAVPKGEGALMRLVLSLDTLEADFLNLNELEYSETNCTELNAQGYMVKDDISSGVLGSEDTARNVVRNVKSTMTVHYCSSGFKDGVQLRRRILRRARNVARPYQIITKDGTLLTGIIEGPHSLVARIRRRLKLPRGLIGYNSKKRHVEVAPWVLDDAASELEFDCYLVEEYPTADGLEVERRKL